MDIFTFSYDDVSVLIRCSVCGMGRAVFRLDNKWEEVLIQFQRAHVSDHQNLLDPFRIDIDSTIISNYSTLVPKLQKLGFPSPNEMINTKEKTSKLFTKKDAEHAVSEAEAILTLALPVTRHERQGCHCLDCAVRFKESYARFCAEFESKE